MPTTNLILIGGIGLGVGPGWSRPLTKRLDIPDDCGILDTFPNRGWRLTRRFWRRFGDATFWTDIREMVFTRLRTLMPTDRPMHIVAHSWGGIVFHDAWERGIVPHDPGGDFVRSVTTLGTPLALHVHPVLGHRPSGGWVNYTGRFDLIGVPLSRKFHWVEDRRVWSTHNGLLRNGAVARHVSGVLNA